MLKTAHSSSDVGLANRRSPPPFSPKKLCRDSFKLVDAYPSEEILECKLQTKKSSHNNCNVKTRQKKSVSFNEEMLVQEIEFEDDDHSKLGRQLYWEVMARDRARFKDRIERLENVLSPVLAAEHRHVIYTHRMETSFVTSFATQFVEVEKLVIVSGNESR